MGSSALLIPITATYSQNLKDGNYLGALFDAHCPNLDPEDCTVKNADYSDDEFTAVIQRIISKDFDKTNFAVAALLLFVQINFTGPQVDHEVLGKLPILVNRSLSCAALAWLSVDGECAYPLTKLPMLLVLARTILERSSDCMGIRWWSIRAARVHQQLLENPSASLHGCGSAAESLLPKALEAWPSDLRAVWHMERAIFHLQYKNDKDAASQLEAARSASAFRFSVSGLMGKRTKFQNKAHTQLVILAQSSAEPEAAQTIMNDDAELNKEIAAGVRSLSLNDDILFEKPQLEGDTKLATQNLSVTDQCILLGYCLHVKNTNSSDTITNEQMFPFVHRILENPNNWTVHSLALLLRSRLESSKSRTVERAVLQIQALVDQIDGSEREAPAVSRLSHFFSVSCPPKWALESELGDKMMAIGMIKTALQIYERLELWEKVVICHMLTKRRDKAQELTEQLLSKNPDSPRLLCLLGDISSEPKWYHRAWDVSNGRHARAMRALGAHYYKAEDYAQSVECWTKALSINPLFEDSWFICGCAALQTENWSVAQEAFSRCTALDHENAEAWNNLATVYIKMKKKPEALRSLREGVKAKYDNWKMWANYLYLAVDLGYLDEAMHAMSRVISLRAAAALASSNAETKAEHDLVDVEVLRMIVDGVLRVDAEQAAPTRVARVAALIQQAVDAASSERQVWLTAAHFYQKTRAWRNALNAHVRAYRSVARDTYTTYDEFKAAVSAASTLCEAYQDLGMMEVVDDADAPACADWAHQSKLVVRGLIARGKDYQCEQAYDEAQRLMDKVKQAGT